MSTKHLLALLNSHIEGDEDQFLSTGGFRLFVRDSQ
jgi:hypothetical protein